ncbi:hypothetical protein CERZMDRAFT_109829 [Cercospora zeae-maydis SCOH1-5]|uniref:Peptide hydrolase n=1 Tax=Cercospora zeae-maydis SCOH1-5 TaxID=717836 RepID=A0A6A6FRL0_9PEZI|nr:hypothetical protein CERZMDRAFT_109829 [Cercospora zeae-maydis SCOH1-5]
MDSKALEDAIKEEALLQKAHELQDAAYKSPMRHRVYGTPGHENTLQLIEKYLKTVEEHYTFERQELELSASYHSEVNGTFSVADKRYDIAFHQYGTIGANTDYVVTGHVVPVASFGCDPSDFPPAVANNIALIHRGECAYEEKLRVATAPHIRADAVIIVNNSTEPLGKAAELTLAGFPLWGPEPLGVISQADGEALAVMAANTPLEGVLEIQERQQKKKTYNLIAQTKQGDQDNVLFVGAHSDSVFAGPGINNNGSGLIAILETALHLPKYAVNHAVRFAFWSAEEMGLIGSRFYLQNLHASEKDKIRLYLYDGHGLPHMDAKFDGTSDYEVFMRECIPSGGILTGAGAIMTKEEATKFGGQAEVAYDENYHGFGDTVENLNRTAFVTNAKAIAAGVAHFSTTLDSIPPRFPGCRSAPETSED